MQKNAKFLSAGGKAPRPPASGSWGLRPLTPIGLRRLGAPPPDPKHTAPHCEFLATRLVPGTRVQIRLFLGLHLYLAEKYCVNPKVPWAQLNVNPAQTITWFVGVTIYCTLFNNNLPPPRQFLCNKILSKKISYSKGNAH